MQGFNPNINNLNTNLDSPSLNKYTHSSANSTFNQQVVVINNRVTSGMGQIINSLKGVNCRGLSGFILKHRVAHQLKMAMKSLKKNMEKFQKGKVDVSGVQNKCGNYNKKFASKLVLN